LRKLKNNQIAIPAVIVLLVATAGAAQLWGEHQAKVRLDETLATLPQGLTGHYESLGYNVFTRTLRINGLTVTRDNLPTLSIEEVVLHHLAATGEMGSPFHAEAVRLRNVQAWRGGHSISATQVTAQNIAILAPGVPAPQGTPSWLIAPGSGTLLSAGSIIANGITDDEGATLAALSMSGYNEGQLRHASASHFADKQGNQIETADARDVDLGGLDRVFDTGRYTPGAPSWPAPHPLIGHAEITGFESHGDGGSGTIDNLTIDDFAARPFASSPTAANVKRHAFARDAAEAISIGSASLIGLHFVDNRTQVVGALGHLSLTLYADGALARFSMSNLSVSGHGTSAATIGHFEMTGLNATPLLHQPPGQSVSNLIEAAGNGGLEVGAMDLAQASVRAPTGVTIALTSLSETVNGNAPVETTLSLRGLSIPAHATPQLEQLLTPLALSQVVLDLDENGSYDPATGDTTVKRAVVTAERLGSLSLSAQFTNVPRRLAGTDDPMAAFSQLGIGAFTFQFTNDTLVQRVTAMLAKQSGKTPAEIADQGKTAASFLAAGLVPGQADAGEQVASFIAAPKTLTITAAPVAPVPLGAFKGPTLRAALTALNLRLTAQ
jgi:hypothetical protein